ncbi:M67 family metallopeptidase [Paenibacillus alba]|uniref:Mov34/MPN/PAD-1 family protein n=1 Tax=Paenibacillus alba TaxID=1197127 RepID=UPI0015655C1B|nr:M67 family metallopeptidase [Paenibacillus alba]NQX68136.1 M67 family metallopeptidase [Paenibacillus alba]
MLVHIPMELYQRLVSYSRLQLPQEACGFILGSQLDNDIGERHAAAFAPLPNISKQPHTQFEINPTAMLPFLLDQEHPVIGIFHSHPTAPPIPSHHDLQSLWHTIPTYWILSLQQPDQPDLQLYQIKKATLTTYHKLSFVIGQ